MLCDGSLCVMLCDESLCVMIQGIPMKRTTWYRILVVELR